MKAIKPYTEIYPMGMNPLLKIEKIARGCYKSEKMIREGSAEKFVANLIKRGHEAMVEHASFIFKMDAGAYNNMNSTLASLKHVGFNCFLRFTYGNRPIVSGNVRAWRDFAKECIKVIGGIPMFMKNFIFENPVLFPEYQDEGLFVKYLYGELTQIGVEDLQTDIEKLTHWDVTVKFVVDRGVSHEIVRHRPASFAQESTRYCNYSKGDFGGEITFIKPLFLVEGTDGFYMWETAMKNAEQAYFDMLNWGLFPEQARTVLPNSLKTEVTMTATLGEWKHFFNLRAANITGKAHPQMVEVARPLLFDMKEATKVTLFDDIELK
jgi:thymidylate synthase (FAD)